MAPAAEPDVTVRPLDGENLKGRLVELSASKVALQTGTGRQQLDSSKLMWVELSAAAATAKVNTWIELLDGSRLHASGYTASEGKARIDLTTGQIIEIPTRSI